MAHYYFHFILIAFINSIFHLKKILEYINFVYNCSRKIKLEPYKQYGLIIDGTSMAAILRSCPGLLKSVGMACEAVICCRLTPLQKSEVRLFDINIRYINKYIKNIKCN